MQYVNCYNEGLTAVSTGDLFASDQKNVYMLTKVDDRQAEIVGKDSGEIKTVSTDSLVRMGYLPRDTATGRAYGPFRTVRDSDFMDLQEFPHEKESY